MTPPPRWGDILFDMIIALLMLIFGLGFFAYLVLIYA